MKLDKRNYTFSDININFGSQESSELVYDADDVSQKILTVLSTLKGSRPFRRSFGSNLYMYVWDQMDDVTVGQVRSSILLDLKSGVPEIDSIKVDVLPDYLEDQMYINISYTIPSLENRESSLNFNLQNSTRTA